VRRRPARELAGSVPEGDPFVQPKGRKPQADCREKTDGSASGWARRRTQSREARRQRAEATAIPASGECRPVAGRDPWALRVEAHRASSAVLRSAYPFLAGETLGSDLVYVGLDRLARASFGWDPWRLCERRLLTNPNWAVLGEIGTGKSSVGKCLAIRNVTFGRRVYVPGDPKGEWAVVAEAAGGRAVRLGRGLRARLNPLDAGPRPAGMAAGEVWRTETEARRRELVGALAELSLGRRLLPVERTALDLGLRTCVRADGTLSRQRVPTLVELVEALFRPDREAAASVAMTPEALADESRALAHELRRLVAGDLAGLFDGPSTESVDPSLPMLVVDTSPVSGSEDLTALVSTCVAAWMEAAIADPGGGQRLVVYDEAWMVMRHLPLLRRMQAAWKLSRSYGTSNGLVVHRLSDLGSVGDQGSEAVGLARGLVADAATRICYQVRADQVTDTAQALGLSDTEAGMLRTLDQGCGLWRVGERSFLVEHVLSSPFEASLVDTDGRMTGRPAAEPA
jgi:hypothetical protein